MPDGNGRAKPTKARFALAANVRHLMLAYSKGFAVGLTPSELAKGSTVSAKTIRRLLDPYSDHTPTLDSVDLIAEFFMVETWELLRPRPAVPIPQEAEVTIPPKPSKARK